MEILSNTQIETLKFYACVGAYAGLCADPPQGHEDAARDMLTAGLLRGEGESYAPTAAGLALVAPVSEAPKPRKDGIRKGAKVVRRKPLVGTYLRPEDKPAVAQPAPVVMTVLELRGQRVRVQVPPCDTWPEGHESWFGRAELRRADACPHARAVAVRLEILDADQVAHCRGTCVVCCGCGAVRHAPVFLGRYTDWSPPLAEQRTPFPDGAALAVLAGPSEDVGAMMAACDEHERARAEEWKRRLVDR